MLWAESHAHLSQADLTKSLSAAAEKANWKICATVSIQIHSSLMTLHSELVLISVLWKRELHSDIIWHLKIINHIIRQNTFTLSLLLTLLMHLFHLQINCPNSDNSSVQYYLYFNLHKTTIKSENWLVVFLQNLSSIQGQRQDSEVHCLIFAYFGLLMYCLLYYFLTVYNIYAALNSVTFLGSQWNMSHDQKSPSYDGTCHSG